MKCEACERVCVGSLGAGSILHKTGYNLRPSNMNLTEKFTPYYNPFYVTYRWRGAGKIQGLFALRKKLDLPCEGLIVRRFKSVGKIAIKRVEKRYIYLS